MMHVFSIHSPITYYSALNVIFFEKLDKNDVILLFTKYVPPGYYGHPVPSFAEHNVGILKKIKNFNLVKAYDNYIFKITNGADFIAYIDLAHYYQKLLITNVKCIQFNFIEEGMASYIAANNLKELTRIESKINFRQYEFKDKIRSIVRILKGFNLKLLGLPYFANAYGFVDKCKFYGFDSAIFPGIENERKIILNPRLLVSTLDEPVNDQNFTDGLILVEENFYHYYKIPEQSINLSMIKSIEFIKANLSNKKIYIKLRPNQNISDSLWKKYLEKNNLNFVVIKGDILLESILVENNNITLFGTISSLLFYGAIFGHISYSNYFTFIKEENLIFDTFNFYWEKVKRIS